MAGILGGSSGLVHAAPATHSPTALTAAPAPREDDPARVALDAASAAKRVAQKLEGEERSAALREVSTRYDSISADDVFEAAARAEAAFRSGEILRALKEGEAADARFLRATELGAESEDGRGFAARGLLERAHLRRRAGDVEAALTMYGQVREQFAGERRSAAHAMTWMGKVLLADERLAEARPVLLGFCEAFPEYPKEAVRNADLLAVELVETGDEAAARVVVAEMRARMAPLLEAGDKQSAALQAALDAMKVTGMLGGY
ncbi:MAG: hypothetical protein ACYTG2_16740 [Planctomycetota bacterium]